MWGSILVWGLGILAPIFVASASSFSAFIWRCKLYTGGGPHLGAGRDVCLRLSRCIPTVSRRTLGPHGDHRHVRTDCEEMLGGPMVDACEPVAQESIGSPVLPRRLYSSLCNQTQTLCWSSRLAREIVFWPLQSDTDALLNQPCCLGDYIPGEIVFQPLQSDTDARCAKSVRCSYFCLVARGQTESGFRSP